MQPTNCEIRSEGITLKSLPYQGGSEILTIFTRDHGMVRLFVRSARRSTRFPAAITAPFTRATLIWNQKNNDSLPQLIEGEVVDQYLKVRKELAPIQAAAAMARAILLSQLADRPVPDLYRLFVTYLKAIPETNNLSALTASFTLKLLRHEGLLADGPELFSQARTLGLTFSEAELQTIALLDQSRMIKEILACPIEEGLCQRIELLGKALLD